LEASPYTTKDSLPTHGNQIIDIHNLKILDPVELENTINQIPGVVTNGLFDQRKAEVTMIAQRDGSIVKQ